MVLARSLAIALLAGALLVAGCGDDDEETGGGATATTQGTTVKSAGAIKLTESPLSQGPGSAPSSIRTRAAGSNSYCSPSGDYCVGVRRQGRSFLLSVATFAFTGRYRLCVTGPPGRACQFFPLKKRGDIYSSTIRLTPPAPGRYTATWFYSGNKLGRSLSFRTP